MRRLFSLLRRAAGIQREGGFFELLTRALSKAASPLIQFGSLYFFLHDLTADIPEAKASVELVLRQATRADLSLVLERRHPPQSREVLSERFQRGDLCFMAIDAAGKLAHSRWAARGRAVRVPENGMIINLRADEAYIYDAYTRRDLRRRGVNAVVRWLSYRQLQAAGVRRVYSYVRGDAPDRVKVAQSCHSSIGRIRYLCLGQKKCWSWGRRTADFPLLAGEVERRPAAGEREALPPRSKSA